MKKHTNIALAILTAAAMALSTAFVSAQTTNPSNNPSYIVIGEDDNFDRDAEVEERTNFLVETLQLSGDQVKAVGETVGNEVDELIAIWENEELEAEERDQALLQTRIDYQEDYDALLESDEQRRAWKQLLNAEIGQTKMSEVDENNRG
jgi:hypothetical protein